MSKYLPKIVVLLLIGTAVALWAGSFIFSQNAPKSEARGRKDDEGGEGRKVVREKTETKTSNKEEVGMGRVTVDNAPKPPPAKNSGGGKEEVGLGKVIINDTPKSPPAKGGKEGVSMGKVTIDDASKPAPAKTSGGNNIGRVTIDDAPVLPPAKNSGGGEVVGKIIDKAPPDPVVKPLPNDGKEGVVGRVPVNDAPPVINNISKIVNSILNSVSASACPKRSAGDANCDGSVTLKDSFYFVAAQAGGKIPDTVNSDFNNDGIIDDTDRAILNESLSKLNL